MSIPGLPCRPRASFALAVAAAALAACGSDPVAPTPATGAPPVVTTYTATTPVTGAVARANYRDTLLAFERDVFYWNDRVNWTQQASSVTAQVNAATTHGGLWNAADASIDPWLRNAGDEHSAFFPPTDAPGVVDSPAGDTRFLVSGTTLPTAGAAPLAYLWLPTYSGKNDVGRADSTQAVIRTLDQSGPCGWVLDLRFNPGGTWASMMAGINPIFGDAPASRTLTGFAGLVDRFDARAYFYVQNGGAGVFDPASGKAYPQVQASGNYTLKRPNSPVAVLLGPLTASAGELITLGFRGGPVPVRTFGEATYGVTTTPVGIYLAPDSGYLNVTAGIMFDRTGQRYGGQLQPDQAVPSGPRCLARSQGGCPLTAQLFGATYARTTPTPDASSDATLQAATTWLRQQAACTGAPAAQRGPRLARAAAAADLPGTVVPSPVPARIGKYFVAKGRTARALAGR